MHLLLTDRLACPRCGPAFGLVLLADRVEDRRVFSGSLGCPNCRARYPVRDGFADLRPPPRTPLPPGTPPPGPDPEQTLRVAALLGVAEGPAWVALVGPVAAHAAALAGLVDELDVIAADAGLKEAPERPGVSRVAVAERLPLRDAVLRAVVLAGDEARGLMEEAVRTLDPGGRLVVIDGREGVLAVAEELGLRILVREGDVLVGERAGPRTASEGVRLPVV